MFRLNISLLSDGECMVCDLLITLRGGSHEFRGIY